MQANDSNTPTKTENHKQRRHYTVETVERTYVVVTFEAESLEEARAMVLDGSYADTATDFDTIDAETVEVLHSTVEESDRN